MVGMPSSVKGKQRADQTGIKERTTRKGSGQTKEQGSSVGGPLASADLLYSFQHPVVGSDIGGRHLAERNESLCVEDPSLTN
jgi:hypothetical protein